MWTLPKPDLKTAQADIDTAFKKSSKMKNLETEELKKIYKDYDDMLGKPNDRFKRSLIITTNQASYIKNTYKKTQGSGDLAYIRSELLQASKNRCVSCGENGRSTLDHYLPESEYKLVAINRQNLIPSCFTCNNLKNSSPATDFIHAYYDKLPNSQFLKAETIINNCAINIKLSIDETAFKKGKRDSLYKKCISQISHIQLENRVNESITNFLTSVFMTHEDITDDKRLQASLKQFIISYERIYGNNDWRTAVLKSLELNSNFTFEFIRPYILGEI